MTDTDTITGAPSIPSEWGQAVAAKVAASIRRACGREADRHADIADQIDDACDAAVNATLQALAEAFVIPGDVLAAPPSEALAQAVAAAREETEKTREALKIAMQLVQRCVGQGIAFEEDDPLPEMESWVVAESIAKTLGIDINSEEYVSLFTAPPTPAQTDTAPGGRA